MEEILHKSIRQVKSLLKAREFTSVELARFYLDRIGTYDGHINAYLRITEEMAMRMAADADRRIGEGTDGALTGIPFGMKDILCTRGVETTCASQILRGFV